MFYRLLEPFKVIGDGLAELVKLGEQVRDGFKLDQQLIALETNSRGQPLHLEGSFLANGNFDCGRLEVLAGFVEFVHNPLAPLLLVAELLTGLNGFQLAQQLLAIDEEGFANLVAAEAVQQLDGLPAFDAEEFFDRGAVEDGNLEPTDLLGAVARIKRGRESSRIRNPRSRHDGVGLRPTELRHPVEDVTPDRGLSHLRVAIPRLQASSEH